MKKALSLIILFCTIFFKGYPVTVENLVLQWKKQSHHEPYFIYPPGKSYNAPAMRVA